MPLFEQAATGQSPLGRELALAGWSSTNDYRADGWELDRLLALKRETVSVVLPTREVADTIGTVLAALG